MRKTWVVCLLAMVCCALWGSAFPCIKVGYRLFQIDSADTATQILFAGCRFTIAGIMVILFGSILQGRFLKAGKGDLPRIGKICLLQTVVQYFFFYVGLAHTTGVKGSIVEASNVFLAILVSSLIFHQEKLDQKKMKQLIQESIKTLEEKRFGYDIILHSNYCLLMAEIFYIREQEGFQIKKGNCIKRKICRGI